MPKIITIGRQFGSGGRELGKRLAEKLGVAYYDKEIISAIAQKSGMAEAYVNSFVEKRINYYPITVGNTFAGTVNYQPDNGVYTAQSNAIRELAMKGDCVIIGRCADYILEDLRPLNLFVQADMEHRVARCREKAPLGEDMEEKELRKRIQSVDKHRAKYYNFFTGRDWGKMENYHLCIDTSGMEIKNIIPQLAELTTALWQAKRA